MLIVDSQSHIRKNGPSTNPAHRDLLHHHGCHHLAFVVSARMTMLEQRGLRTTHL